MESQLSLRRLEVFRLVVEERSVTRAAEILMVAQPAVSAQLRSLESWLGAKLFTRQGNRLVLTEAGERVDHWAREVIAGSLQVRRDVQELASGHGGGVVIACSMAVGTYLIPPLLADFQASRTGPTDITTVVQAPQDALRAVEAGEADFAVIGWDRRDLPGTTSWMWLRDEQVLLCARPGMVPRGSALTVDEALALPLVGAPRNVVYQRDLMDQLRSASTVEPHFVMRLGHAEAMKQAAVDHDWAVFASRYCVERDLADGRLEAIEVRDLHLVERIALLWRRDAWFSPLQRAAFDAVVAGLGTPDAPVAQPIPGGPDAITGQRPPETIPPGMPAVGGAARS